MLEPSVSELDLNVKFCAVLTRSLSHGSGRFGAVNFPSVSEHILPSRDSVPSLQASLG